MVHIEIVDNPRKEFINAISTKNNISQQDRVVFITIETFTHIFTPERMRLIRYLKEHKVESISDLARKLGRKFEAVHRDIKYLEGFVIVAPSGKTKIPTVEKKIEVSIL